MLMRSGPSRWRAAAGAGLGIIMAAALLALTRTWLAVPGAVVLLVLPPLLVGWVRARAALEAELCCPRPLQWLDRAPQAREVWASREEELRGLGYRHAGFLEDPAPEDPRVA